MYINCVDLGRATVVDLTRMNLKGVNPLRLIIRYRKLGHAKASSVCSIFHERGKCDYKLSKLTGRQRVQAGREIDCPQLTNTIPFE